MEKIIIIHVLEENVPYNHSDTGGTASHSLDYKRSAGAFIHGYRYTGAHVPACVQSDMMHAYTCFLNER